MIAARRLQEFRELVANCLDDVEAEVEGFPVKPLLHDILAACEQGPAASRHMMLLVDNLLASWVRQLDRDLQAMTPPSPAVQLQIKARMRATQQGLAHVQRMLERLRQWCAEDSVHLTETH